MAQPSIVESDSDRRSGLSKEALKRSFLDNLLLIQGKYPGLATRRDYYMALSFAIRERIMQRWISTAAAYAQLGARTVAYLSAEFLTGPHLGNNLVNLGVMETMRQVMAELGLDLETLLESEEEPGLGNGGLGRLAACFLDSLATLEIPSLGYGIRYEFGIFEQEITSGWQVEKADSWLRFGNPWELPRPEWAVRVNLGGTTEHFVESDGRLRVRWLPERVVEGVPYDTPVLGYLNNTANTLRLWRADAPQAFDLATFNRGDYYGAVRERVTSENLSKVLYPNDEHFQGKELRLEQQYFFVSCSLQDMFRIMRSQRIPVERFHEKFAVQLNDTHPAIAVAELMRLLIDEHAMSWEDAWSITSRTFAYTNHTLLPEALERWSVGLFGRLLPRHLEIVYEINARFLDQVRVITLGDDERVTRLSLIDETGDRSLRMAHLACLGSHTINGVAELHSDLVKSDLFADFHQLWPERFTNVTNGVTPRRWLSLSNPRLAKLITDAIGDGWTHDLEELRTLEAHADDAAFRKAWGDVKLANKREFSAFTRERAGISVDPEALLGVQVKRIHEYKRQHLAILYVIALYRRLKTGGVGDFPPRTFIFGGKAAPGYFMAKLIIRLITAVAEVVNRDPDAAGRLRIIFLPNFNVTLGQRVYPAAELSEQLSTAGKEASGTSNMKFSMNGALTIGTLDGANVELREAVGADNFFRFGLDADEAARHSAGGYRPMEVYEADPELREALDLIRGGYFSRGDPELFRPLLDNLLCSDPYLVLADFRSYVEAQATVSKAYLDPDGWARMSILNTSRSGFFSSDRAIREYCDRIWRVKSVGIGLLSGADVEACGLQ